MVGKARPDRQRRGSASRARSDPTRTAPPTRSPATRATPHPREFASRFNSPLQTIVRGTDLDRGQERDRGHTLDARPALQLRRHPRRDILLTRADQARTGGSQRFTTMTGSNDFPRVQVIPQVRRASFCIDGVERAGYEFGDGAPRPFRVPVARPFRHESHPAGTSQSDRPRAPQVDLVWAPERRRHQFLGRLAGERHPHPPPLRQALPRRQRLGRPGGRSRLVGAGTVDHPSRAEIVIEPGRVTADSPRPPVSLGFLERRARRAGKDQLRIPGRPGRQDDVGTVRRRAIDRRSRLARAKPRSSASPARWVDYSGPSAPGKVEGICVMDHPANPSHPVQLACPRRRLDGSIFQPRIALRRGARPSSRLDDIACSCIRERAARAT